MVPQEKVLDCETLGLRDKAMFWRTERYDSLECLSASIYRHRYAPHTHDTYVVGTIVAGCERFTVCGMLQRAGPGDVCFINPGEVHDGESQLSPKLNGKTAQQDLKKFAATFGDCVGLFMRSPGHKQYRLQDLEWLLLPALQLNQFTILSGAPKDSPEIQLPLGLALWAKVSPEVDEKVSANLSGPLQLKPEDWNSGDVPWLIDIAGAPEVSRILVAQVSRNAFKGQNMKMRVKTKDGAVEVKTVRGAEEGAETRS